MTVALAVVMRNVWALVIGLLLTAALGTVLSYIFHSYRPRLALEKIALRRALTFGKFTLVIAVASYVTTMADNVMVGRLLGTAALGNYSLAYNVASAPIIVLVFSLSKVLFPAYAEITAQHPKRLGAGLYQSIQYLLADFAHDRGAVVPAGRRDSSTTLRRQVDQRGNSSAGPGVDHSPARARSDHVYRFLRLEQTKTGGRGKNSGSGRLSRRTVSVDNGFRIDRRSMGRSDRLCVRMRKPPRRIKQDYPRHLVKARSNFTLHRGGGRGRTADCKL